MTQHSFPTAFKSRYYVEYRDWDAHFKVDYDTHKNPINLKKIKLTLQYLKQRSYEVTSIKAFETGRGHHLRVWTNGIDIPAYTVLRIQAMFGDDPIRQRFNMRRVRRREDGWNVLWNEKWRNGKLLSNEMFDERLTQQIKRMIPS